MQQISKVKLAEIILFEDKLFREKFSLEEEEDTDELDVLFGYGDYVIPVLRNAYSLNTHSEGVSALTRIVSRLVEHYDTDDLGIIDIYVFEAIVDAGKSEFLWFLQQVKGRGQALLKEFSEADVSVTH